jgi:hypothetical protein
MECRLLLFGCHQVKDGFLNQSKVGLRVWTSQSYCILMIFFFTASVTAAVRSVTPNLEKIWTK